MHLGEKRFARHRASGAEIDYECVRPFLEPPPLREHGEALPLLAEHLLDGLRGNEADGLSDQSWLRISRHTELIQQGEIVPQSQMLHHLSGFRDDDDTRKELKQRPRARSRSERIGFAAYSGGVMDGLYWDSEGGLREETTLPSRTVSQMPGVV